MLKINIVIVTYNRLNLLKEAVRAAVNQTYKAHRIFIVDNCSTDGTDHFLRNLEYDQITVTRTSRNIGGAGGFAEGVRLCENSGDYDYLMLIDDDAILNLDCLEALASAINKHPNVPALSTVVRTNGEIDTGHRQRFAPRLLARLSNVPREEYEQDYFVCDVATFCGIAIKNPIIKRIGLPKADFFIWNDDVEYSVRIDQFGGILNVNNACLNHKTTAAPPTKMLSWKSYYGYRNLLAITRRHMTPIATMYQIVRITAYAFLFWAKRQKVNGENALSVCFAAIKDGLADNLGINSTFMPKSK